MINKDALGAVGEPFELVVERGKVGEMALAVGAQDLAHPVPTFFTTIFHWERLRAGSNPWHKVAMSEERGMHAEQEYVFHGPPPGVGTKLVCTSRIDSITEKQGKRGGTLTFVVMVTEMRDETGALRVEARMTGVETEVAP
jgi:hydroxyacyl-ACP dehydratase HTD2-like protein with hotdog domain